MTDTSHKYPKNTVLRFLRRTAGRAHALLGCFSSHGIAACRIRGYRTIEGYLSEDEAIALYRIAASLPTGSTVVEIGSWKGKSTYCLARGLRRGGRVVAIDPFNAAASDGSAGDYQQHLGVNSLFEQFERNMRQRGVYDRVTPLRGYSADFVGQIPTIDFLFIDGDHSIESCDFDFTQYSPFIRAGGYLAFHDYDPARKDLGPTWVIENKVQPSPDYRFVGRFQSLWVAKRIR